MKHLHIGVDIDDTIAKFAELFINIFDTQHGTTHDMKDMDSYSLPEFLGISQEEFDELLYWHATGNSILFSALRAEEDSVFVCDVLAKTFRCELFFLTSRVNAAQTIEWLVGQSFCSRNVFLMKQKWRLYESLKLDVMIDDKPENLVKMLELGKLALLYDKPWNQKEERFVRVKSWNEILIKILEYANKNVEK